VEGRTEGPHGVPLAAPHGLQVGSPAFPGARPGGGAAVVAPAPCWRLSRTPS